MKKKLIQEEFMQAQRNLPQTVPWHLISEVEGKRDSGLAHLPKDVTKVSEQTV